MPTETADARPPDASPTIDAYLKGRWQQQLDYAEQKAAHNQVRYHRTRRLMLVSSWLTPVAIFFLVLTPQAWRDLASVVPLLLSTTTVGAYQWEEQNNFGALWTKFRLMAERMKRHRELFLQRAGPYSGLDDVAVTKVFVEFTENLIEGTDVHYFTLMVEPSERPIGKLKQL